MAARVNINGIPIDAVDLATATERVSALIESGRAHQVVTINLDFLAIADRNPAFHRVLRAADLALADGQPVVWLSRSFGTPLPQRVTGIDLIHTTCAMGAQRGYRPFLLGAAPGVAAKAGRILEERYPGLRVAGAYSPPFGSLSQEDDDAIVEMVRQARPDLLFVALGAPRQDIWIHEHLADLGVPVSMGVGGAFNFITGNVPRAPQWMRQAGMEWFFRMCQEPGRLWRRYLIDDMPVMLRLAMSGPNPADLDTIRPLRPQAWRGQALLSNSAGLADEPRFSIGAGD